jgi:putative Holliday junction resolvase
MQILGVDYGKKRIGIAIATSTIAEPLTVIKVKRQNEAIEKIGNIVKENKTEEVILGISEGEMAEETRKFGETLEKHLSLPIKYQDETLSTKDADSLAIEAGIGPKKRKSLRDAYAATVMLQEYIDTNY